MVNKQGNSGKEQEREKQTEKEGNRKWVGRHGKSERERGEKKYIYIDSF